ncbi:MAG: tetratricopeptide repeat protein [Planctomycetaceae bacterium]
MLLNNSGFDVHREHRSWGDRKGGEIHHYGPTLFGPVITSPYYGYGYGYGGYGHHHRFHSHNNLGIRTPPYVNRFTFRAPPIAIAPYTYYQGDAVVPYFGFNNGYYGGYYGNPYYTYNSYYYGNTWGWGNRGYYGNNFNVPEQTYRTPAAIQLENLKLKEQVDQNRRDWIEKIPGMPDRVIIAVRPSSTDDNLKSVRSQGLGDLALQNGDYKRAFEYYKRAVQQSGDKAEFRISLAVVLAATGRFEQAVNQIELAVELQPEMKPWPRTLEQIFHEKGESIREKMMAKMYEWAAEDQQDGQRLLLLGSFLALSEKPLEAQPFLEIAAQSPDYDKEARAFLEPIREDVEEVTASIAAQPNLPPPGYGVLEISPQEATVLKAPPIPEEPQGTAKPVVPEDNFKGPAFPE